MMAEAAKKTKPRRVVVRTRTTVLMGSTARRTVVSSKSSPEQQKNQVLEGRGVPKKLVEPFPFQAFAFEMLIVVVIAVIFVLQVGLHVHQVYLHPYIETIRWTVHRQEVERTYPAFACENASAVTNANPVDFFILTNATVEQAVNQVMLDGAAVFSGLIPPQDAEQLRHYLLARPSDQDRLPVIAQKHRRSFALTATEDPILPIVLKSISTNALLRDSLEELLGPNPALLALSTIIAEPGATDQRFHLDKEHAGSHMQYGLTFAPNYALLIPLQDTTPCMGATAVCPGTHRCDSIPDEICNEHGFHVSNHNGTWPAGHGLLYNGQVRHRGSANTSPDTTRVVLILTFGTRPGVGQLMLPLGSLFALRADMWGFCLSDLKDAEKYMANPVWRSLGLYKHPDTEWGWDYVRLTLHRIANDALLESIITTVQNRGHAWWVNLILIGVTMEEIGDGSDDELWGAHEKVVVAFFQRLGMTAGIACVFAISYYLMWTKTSISRRAALWALLRIAICSITCCLTMYWAIKATVNTVYWQQIANMSNKTTSSTALSKQSASFECPPNTTLVQPKFEDVLVGNRLKEDSTVRAMSRFLDFHYGN